MIVTTPDGTEHAPYPYVDRPPPHAVSLLGNDAAFRRRLAMGTTAYAPFVDRR